MDCRWRCRDSGAGVSSGGPGATQLYGCAIAPTWSRGMYLATFPSQLDRSHAQALVGEACIRQTTLTTVSEPFEFQGRTITPQNLYIGLFLIGKLMASSSSLSNHLRQADPKASPYSSLEPRSRPSSGSSARPALLSARTLASSSPESSREFKATNVR